MKIKAILFVLGLVVLTEVILRVVWGFGDPPLYVADKDFEYIYAPDQDLVRFGNRIRTNRYSMRSGPLSAGDKLRILKIGDSVINGGSHTDHDSLASTILERQLSETLQQQVRVLNVSAGTWGVDNAMAYIHRYGHFEADLLVMVYSSHDLYDQMTFKPIVDHHHAYPGHKPLLAIQEVIFRYAFIGSWLGKSSKDPGWKANRGTSNSGKINPGFAQLFQYTRDHRLPVLFYMHPTGSEIRRKAYDPAGRQLLELISANNIKIVRGLDFYNDQSQYRDDIHLNEKGQRHLAARLFEPILEMIR